MVCPAQQIVALGSFNNAELASAIFKKSTFSNISTERAVETIRPTIKKKTSIKKIGEDISEKKNNIASLKNISLNTKNTNVSVDSSKDENCCLIRYYLVKNGTYKYGLHVEGQVKDCGKSTIIEHAYVSINSALNADKFLIVPTDINGKFYADVADDSIAGMTIMKKGYADKSVSIGDAVKITDNVAYSFNVCLSKEGKENSSKKLEMAYSTQEMGKVFFDFNKHSLSNETKTTLDNVINTIKSIGDNNPEMILELNGYADAKGSVRYNKELSRLRSEACKHYLEKKGLTHVKVRIKAMGKQRVLGTNSNIRGIEEESLLRAKDRRVDIVLRKRKIFQEMDKN